MRINRGTQVIASLAAASALLAACGGGSQVAPAGNLYGNSAARGTFPGSTAQSVFRQALLPNVAYSQMGMTYALSASGETVKFPADGDATGSSTVPGVTSTPLPTLNFCESNAPISGSTGSCTTGPSSPDTNCTEAANTFWYNTLELTNGAEENHFAKSDIPVKLKSKTLIPSNSKAQYGLCVEAFGIVLQDDFKSGDGGKPVLQKKSQIKLKLIIPKELHGNFPTAATASIFFEHD